MLIQDYLLASARHAPEAIAIVSEEERLDYRTLAERAARVAGAMTAAGLRPGDRVVLLAENSANYVAAYFGTLMAGGVVVAHPSGSRERQLLTVVRHCRPRGIFATGRGADLALGIANEWPAQAFLFHDGDAPSGAEKARILCRSMQDILQGGGPAASGPSPVRGPEDLAQIIYTSGTTAEPKGVMLSHKNLRANTDSIVQYLRLAANERIMAVLPFYYSYGNSLMLTHVACGGRLVLDNRFAYPEKILERMKAEEVTGFSGVPSTFAILVRKAGLKNHAIPSLRYVTQAGGPMSPALARELESALPGVEIFIMYGQTEASARLSYLDPKLLHKKPGSIGRAIPGVALRVLNDRGEETAPGEVGEITAQGDNIMMGYWENPEATEKVLTKDGLRTGDLATRDEEGFLYIVSRKSDMIKSGAHRISPKEIEEVIQEDERVLEAAVVGEPDPLLGEAIAALVVLKPGAEATALEIARACGRNLPLYKVPKRIEFRRALPKTASGKIQRQTLRRELERK